MRISTSGLITNFEIFQLFLSDVEFPTRRHFWLAVLGYVIHDPRVFKLIELLDDLHVLARIVLTDLRDTLVQQTVLLLPLFSLGLSVELDNVFIISCSFHRMCACVEAKLVLFKF